MRAQWLHDMRVAFEKNHIGWAMWDYQTNFVVVTKTNGVHHTRCRCAERAGAARAAVALQADGPANLHQGRKDCSSAPARAGLASVSNGCRQDAVPDRGQHHQLLG
jgi:hypothetical protein